MGVFNRYGYNFDYYGPIPSRVRPAQVCPLPDHPTGPGDIRLVADVLGHNDINTTAKHYAAMDDEHRRQAANINPYE